MNKAFNKVIKSHILLAVLTVFAVALLSIGVTYSIFQIDQKNTKNQVIEIGVLDASGTSTVDSFVLDDLYPESASKITDENKKFTFTISNTGTYDVKYTVYMKDITNAFLENNVDYAEYKSLTYEYYKYINYILDGDKDSLTNLEKAKASDKFIVMTGVLKVGESEDHYLQFFLDNKDTTTEGAPNDINGSLISLDIHFDAEAFDEKYTPTISEEVLAHMGKTAYAVTPNFLKVAPSISSYVDQEFSETLESRTVTGKIAFSRTYTFDETTGQYALVNPTIASFEEALIQMYPGDYISSSGPADEPPVKDIVTLQQFVSGSGNKIFYHQKQAKVDISEGASGIYTMEDDYGKSFYFRGDVTDNYVKFANIYWRILRINGDGSLRLVYDGTLIHKNGSTDENRIYKTGVKFNDETNDNRFLGYMHGTSSSTLGEAQSNTESSNVKKILDEMYKNKLLDYEKYISDTLFCHDRSISSGLGYGTSDTIYNGQKRFDIRTYPDSTHSPILKCSNKNDAYTVDDTEHGNGELTYPIGLLTADETVLAGAVYFETNESFYLRKGQAFWVMTAFDYTSAGARNLGVNMYGALARAATNQTTYGGVVPVINIKAEYALKMTGSGTSSSPYKIE